MLVSWRCVVRFSCLLSLLVWNPLSGQWNPLSGQEVREPVRSPEALPPRTYETQRWEFGLEIQGNGLATGIIATVPIPIEWPEQSIQVVEEKQSDGVTRISYKELGDQSKQMIIKIDRLNAGDVLIGSVVMDIDKRVVEGPHDPTRYRFATAKETRTMRKYLRSSPHIETTNRRVRQFVDTIPVNETDSAWEQVQTIYEFLRDHIEYEFDTQIRSCMEAIECQRGDCEELSSLFIAACRNRKIPARAVWIPDHTFAEFYLVDDQGKGHWFPAQLAGDYAFGSMQESRPILQKGDRFKIADHPKELRYVQPTLKARHAEAAPSLKWIMQRIDDFDPSGAEPTRSPNR